MGASASRMVTRGYGGSLREIIATTIESVKRIVGQSGLKRKQYDENQYVTITAILVEVNNNIPITSIKGTIKIIINNSIGTTKVLAEHVLTKVKHIYNDIKIIVRLLK